MESAKTNLLKWLTQIRETEEELPTNIGMEEAASTLALDLASATSSETINEILRSGTPAESLQRVGVGEPCTTLIFLAKIDPKALASHLNKSEESKDNNESKDGSTEGVTISETDAVHAVPSDEGYSMLVQLAKSCILGDTRVKDAIKEVSTAVGIGCSIVKGNAAIVINLAEVHCRVTEVDGSAEKGASGVVTVDSHGLLIPGKKKSIKIKVMPDDNFDISSYAVYVERSQPAFDLSRKELNAGLPFIDAGVVVLDRSLIASGDHMDLALRVSGNSVIRDDEFCVVIEVPVSGLYQTVEFCSSKYIIDVFTVPSEEAVTVTDGEINVESVITVPEVTVQERNSSRFVIHVVDHHEEHITAAKVASSSLTSVSAGSFSDIQISFSPDLPQNFSPLTMPVCLLSPQFRRLPVTAGFSMTSEDSGLAPIVHAIIISGDSKDSCLAECPTGYELIDVNLSHEIAANLGALPAADSEFVHADVVSHPTQGSDAVSAEGEVAISDSAVAEEVATDHPVEESKEDNAPAVAVEGMPEQSDVGNAEVSEIATTTGDIESAVQETDAPTQSDESHAVKEVDTVEAGSSASIHDEGILKRISFDVYPAFSYIAVTRGTKRGMPLQHLALAAVVSLPRISFHSPPAVPPNGYSSQITDLAVRTALKQPHIKEDGTEENNERRLVRIVLVQCDDANLVSDAADSAAVLTIGEYDEETRKEMAEAEAAALAAAAAEEYAADREELLEMLRASMSEEVTLLNRNSHLQKEISEILFSNLNEEGKAKITLAHKNWIPPAMASSVQQYAYSINEKKYHEILDKIAAERVNFEAEEDKYGAKALHLQRQLDDKDAKLGQVSRALRDFKVEVAKASVDAKSGKRMPTELITRYEKTEAEKNADVDRMVLKNLFVQGQINKLSEQMLKREQLADGLALVDFEQLKIENSTLAEKIDERNEEISKLRRKTITAVQTLTHLREKLHFVNADVSRLQTELAATEKQVSEQRRSLGYAKKEREVTRADTEKARNMQGFAYNDSLAIDYELRKRNVHVLKTELLQQMKRYEDLQSFTSSILM
jgi:hypothetical protein